MNRNNQTQTNRRSYSLRSLKNCLRNLSQMNASEDLESRLLASIPDLQERRIRACHLEWFGEVKQIGIGATAAVLSLGLLLVFNYNVPQPPRDPAMEYYDTALIYPSLENSLKLYDQNSF